MLELVIVNINLESPNEWFISSLVILNSSFLFTVLHGILLSTYSLVAYSSNIFTSLVHEPVEKVPLIKTVPSSLTIDIRKSYSSILKQKLVTPSLVALQVMTTISLLVVATSEHLFNIFLKWLFKFK